MKKLQRWIVKWKVNKGSVYYVVFSLFFVMETSTLDCEQSLILAMAICRAGEIHTSTRAKFQGDPTQRELRVRTCVFRPPHNHHRQNQRLFAVYKYLHRQNCLLYMSKLNVWSYTTASVCVQCIQRLEQNEGCYNPQL